MRSHDHESDKIDAYLSKAGRLLERRLPKELAEQRLAEARAHITDRAEELMAQGMAQDQAERTATAVFGPAAEWTRTISLAAYADTRARMAGKIATISGLIACFCVPAALVTATKDSPASSTEAAVFIALYLLGLVGMGIGAFRSRMNRTSLMALAAALAIVGSTVYTGTTFLAGRDGIWSRAKIAPALGAMPLELREYSGEADLLKAGIAAYSGDLAIPPALRSANGSYIVPKPLTTPVMLRTPFGYQVAPEIGRASFAAPSGDPIMSAFKEFTPAEEARFANTNYYRTLALRIQTAQQASARTVPTEAQAASEWRAWGPKWLAVMQYSAEWDRQELASYGMGDSGSTGFSWKCAQIGFFLAGIVAAPIVLLDYLAAWLGRLHFRRRTPERQQAGA